MSAYRAYITVHGDDGKRLGRAGLEPVVQNLQAHVDEAFAETVRQGYRGGHAYLWIASHLGKPVIRFEASEAWEVRVAYKPIKAFLKNTGWVYSIDLNANTRRAL